MNARELIQELQKFHPQARVSVLVDSITAAGCLCGPNAMEDTNFEADGVSPIGCNPMDLQIICGDGV